MAFFVLKVPLPGDVCFGLSRFSHLHFIVAFAGLLISFVANTQLMALLISAMVLLMPM
jgi:ABC-2 type transport system permease protein